MTRHDDWHSEVAILSRNSADRPDVVISILRAGVLAQEFCQGASRSTVEAVFERCFYLRRGDNFICVGGPDIGNGPITLIGNLGGLPDRELRPGQLAEVNDQHIAIGNVVRLDLDRVESWRPPVWPNRSSSVGWFHTCAGLARRAAIQAPQEGLARYISGRPETPGCHTPLARVAGPRIAMFEQWLLGVLKGDATPTIVCREAVQGLIGLGPGLTPSGDDFLVGALALLDAIGEREAHAALARAILDAAPGLTTLLSACFLRAAAAGQVSEALHRAVSSAITRDSDAAVAAIEKIGHSSGWDMMAGVMTALRLAATVRRQASSTAHAFALS